MNLIKNKLVLESFLREVISPYLDDNDDLYQMLFVMHNSKYTPDGGKHKRKPIINPTICRTTDDIIKQLEDFPVKDSVDLSALGVYLKDNPLSYDKARKLMLESCTEGIVEGTRAGSMITEATSIMAKATVKRFVHLDLDLNFKDYPEEKLREFAQPILNHFGRLVGAYAVRTRGGYHIIYPKQALDRFDKEDRKYFIQNKVFEDYMGESFSLQDVYSGNLSKGRSDELKRMKLLNAYIEEFIVLDPREKDSRNKKKQGRFLGAQIPLAGTLQGGHEVTYMNLYNRDKNSFITNFGKSISYDTF